MSDTPAIPHVVIVGGGFAGLCTARHLGRSAVRVTLIDRRNFHLFQPLLYQVATGGLSPADISAPLREVLKRQGNTSVVLGEVRGFDVGNRKVLLAEGDPIPYDTLIVAAGATHHYFGNPDWERFAPGLKTVEDATAIRSRILEVFELAEQTRDEEERAALLTFLVVGAGPTGVELAGAIGELSRHTLRANFRNFDPATARIFLVEGSDRVLPPYPPSLSAAAARSLARLGVDVLTGWMMSDLDSDGATLKRGDEVRRIAAETVLWAAGVQASPLAVALAEATGGETDRAGRLLVTGRCHLPGHPEILAIGDIALQLDGDGHPLPGTAPVAIQQGLYAARLVKDRLRGRETPAFRYRDKGSLAVIGRAAAVAQVGGLRISGYPAWLLWLFIHIMYLVGFSNRLLVLMQWAYSFVTRGRMARLITGQATPACPPDRPR